MADVVPPSAPPAREGTTPPIADGGDERLSPAAIRRIRRTRAKPRPTQFDFLHLRVLVRDLADALGRVPDAPDVLDVFCGARPYDALLPPGSRAVGLDVTDAYGVADVVSGEFLPFADASFDLVTCIEAFHFVADPVRGVAEIRRVLRPGGRVLISVPLVWEYDETILEHRYTGPELAALFAGWDDVDVVRNGGRGVAWATLSGSIVHAVEQRCRQRSRRPRLVGAVAVAPYLAINLVGWAVECGERRRAHGPRVLPMNLLVTARRPPDG